MVTKEKSKKKVLIIEDDAFLVKAYQIRFSTENIETIVATNADEAEPYFKKEPPQAVLLDLMLPGTNGFELLEEMKKTDLWKNVPVIIVSNLSQSKDIELGKRLGATDYVVKADTKVADVVTTVIRNMK